MKGLKLYISKIDFILLSIQLVIYFGISSAQVKKINFPIHHSMEPFYLIILAVLLYQRTNKSLVYMDQLLY